MRVEKSAGEAGMHGGWQGGEADGDGGGGAHVCAHDEHDERDAHRGATAGVEGERQTESGMRFAIAACREWSCRPAANVRRRVGRAQDGWRCAH